MTGTLINETNSEYFLPAVPTEILLSTDIFVGVTDDETDTACGVLAAAAIGDHVIAIRFMWVPEEYRGRGAGTELVLTLMEAAESMKASSIVCAHSRGNMSDGIEETLSKCGFVRYDEQTSPIYAIGISELIAGKSTSAEDGLPGIKIIRLSGISDKKWQTAYISWEDHAGSEAGLRAFERRRSSFDQELSFVAIDNNKDIVGMLLGIRSQMGYELQFLTAVGKQTPRILLSLIQHVTDAVAEELGEDGAIIISPPNDSSMKIIEQITGGAYITVGETSLYTCEL